jgi:two-component system phosphate regulon response regulator PhoB
MANMVVIEDEPDISMLVEATLTFGGHKVHVAANGRGGLDLIGRHRPELVLLDVQMPDMSGYDVLQLVKNNPELSHIPVFLFSAKNRPEDIRRGMDLGASGFLFKPFDPKELLEQVGEILEQRSCCGNQRH